MFYALCFQLVLIRVIRGQAQRLKDKNAGKKKARQAFALRAFAFVDNSRS
jgi:hypothetical protein